MTDLLTVTSSPHIKTKRTTQSIMLDVIIAMLPALAWSVYKLGTRSLLITAVSVVCCVAAEALYEVLLKKPSTVDDLSAVVTGILIAFNMPVTIPLWMPALAGVFAIVVVKQLFGGIGLNIVNPALAARVFLFISFPSYMLPMNTSYSTHNAGLVNVDTVASATPLAKIMDGTLPKESLLDMFLGNINGVIGEISALAILLGGVYLLIRKVITWQIPVAYLGSAAIIALIATPEGLNSLQFCGYEILGGGIMLAAFFMATDYATSPITPVGKIIFGVGCGALTMFIRIFSSNAEGASFAVLIMNLLVYYIERITVVKRFGAPKKEKAKKEEKS